MSYTEVRAKYGFSAFDNKLAATVQRMMDFDSLDFEIEEIEDKPTAEQVERILDRFNMSMVDDDLIWCSKLEHMRDAIREICLDGFRNL